MKYIQKLQEKGVSVAEEVSLLFQGELNPVAGKAQRKVPVPDGYVLTSQTMLSYIPNVPKILSYCQSDKYKVL